MIATLGFARRHPAPDGHRLAPHRTREPRAGREAAAPARRREGRRRPAGDLPPDGCRRPQGRHLLRRHASPPRHRDEPGRTPRGHLPRRADHGPRPRSPHRSVGRGQGTREHGHDRAADHAVPRRGRTSGRPHRDPARGPHHRRRHARRAEEAAPGREGRVRTSPPTRRHSPAAPCGTSSAAPTRSSPRRSPRSR